MTMPNSMGNPADGGPSALVAGQDSVERGQRVGRNKEQGSLIRPGSIDGPITNRIAWLRQQRRENLP
jgi:hypothetical protein